VAQNEIKQTGEEKLTPKRVFQILKDVGLENDEHYHRLFQGMEDNTRFNLGVHPLVAHILSKKGYVLIKENRYDGFSQHIPLKDLQEQITTTCIRDDIIFIVWHERIQHNANYGDSYSQPVIAAVYMDVRTVRSIHTSDEEFVVELIKDPPMSYIPQNDFDQCRNQLIKDMDQIAAAFGKRSNMRIQEVSDFQHVATHNAQPRSLS